jgi:hypothetical protein
VFITRHHAELVRVAGPILRIESREEGAEGRIVPAVTAVLSHFAEEDVRLAVAMLGDTGAGAEPHR